MMPSQAKPRSALVVDMDPKFLKSLKDSPKAATHPPFIARTGKEAQLLIANTENALAGLFINLKVITPEGGPDALSVIRFSKQRRPHMPIYILQEGTAEGSIDQIKGLGVKDVLSKPIAYADLINLVCPEIVFDSSAALAQTSQNPDQVGAETAADDQDLVAISAEDFVSGSKSMFNVYIRLSSGKYIMLLRAGDTFSPERLNNYLSKGVINFYLRKEEQHLYLAYCQKLSNAIMKSDKVSIQAKLSQASNFGQETMSLLKGQGVSEKNLQYASDFVQNVHLLANQLDILENPSFNQFASDVANYEHGVSTSLVASLIAGVLGIESHSSVQIVGVASLMHDIGLGQIPAELHDEDESKMSEEQLKIYRTHPSISADILKQMHGINPSVVQAVLQHHERRNKKGFSSQGKVKQINRVAEIIGISDEFVRIAKKAKLLAEAPKKDGQEAFDPLAEMELNVFDGFTSSVVEAFRVVFYPKD